MDADSRAILDDDDREAVGVVAAAVAGAMGLRDLRVRHHGDAACLEVPVEDIAAVAVTPLHEQVLTAVRSAGFRFIALDLAGVQSGAFTLELVSGPRD
ncbi:adenine nucleotide alpha-hydrolase family protein [Geodermatophilus chilensis]|jgi:uncharacterized protein|uniref:hypothetical protein n=1 Tax=Geodermatophilus chilensis TaxID=2035835 RepID=UPI0012FFDA8B|nr:hypothetical protein [Geodermatophilus chilensis]